MVDGMMRALWALTIALNAWSVNAADLPDPTRPPASLVQASDEALLGQKVTVTPSAGLQSTLISSTRRAAIIDGKTVELGAKHGEAQLIEVNEGNVVLQNGSVRQVLSLFPDVNMTRSGINIKPTSPNSGSKSEEVTAKKVGMNKKHLSERTKEKK